MTYSKIILMVGVSFVALAACTHPSAMPSGYTHHHQEYQSPDPTSSFVGLGVQKSDQDLSQADIDRAVDDVLRKITARAGVSPKPVYIVTPQQMTPFYSAVDNALRDTMRDLGYALSDTEIGAYGFAYSARNLPKPRGTENDGYPNVELMLKVYDSVSSSARLLTEQSGNYYIEGAQDQTIQPVANAFAGYVRKPATVTTIPSTSAPVVYQPAPTPPTKMEVIEPKPIMPTIEYGSLSKNNSDIEYSQRRSVNESPLTERDRVSKKIEY